MRNENPDLIWRVSKVLDQREQVLNEREKNNFKIKLLSLFDKN